MKYQEIAHELRSLGCEELPRRRGISRSRVPWLDRGAFFEREELPRRRGVSRRKWYNRATGRIVSVPDWGSKDLKMGTWWHIVRQLGLDWEASKRV
jgi:hypothetical protein